MLNELIRKIFRRNCSNKDIAKKRLQFALLYDKLDLTDDILSNLQRDIVEVVSRYFEIDRNSLKLDIQKSDNLSALVMNSPIISSKRRVRSMAKQEARAV